MEENEKRFFISDCSAEIYFTDSFSHSLKVATVIRGGASVSEHMREIINVGMRKRSSVGVGVCVCVILHPHKTYKKRHNSPQMSNRNGAGES